MLDLRAYASAMGESQGAQDLRAGIALLLAPLAAITLAACGGGNKAAPTTTRAPAAPTTAAPTTRTTAPKTLTRDAKLAVLRCLDNLNMPGPSVLPADLSVHDESSSKKTMTDCDEAMRQVELDVPASMLAVDLAEINVAVSQLKLAWSRGESMTVGSPATEAYYTKITPAIAGAISETQKLS